MWHNFKFIELDIVGDMSGVSNAQCRLPILECSVNIWNKKNNTVKIEIIEINWNQQPSLKNPVFETNSSAFERQNFGLSNKNSVSIRYDEYLSTDRSAANRNVWWIKAKLNVHFMLREWFNAQLKFHRIRELIESCRSIHKVFESMSIACDDVFATATNSCSDNVAGSVHALRADSIAMPSNQTIDNILWIDDINVKKIAHTFSTWLSVNWHLYNRLLFLFIVYQSDSFYSDIEA